MAEELGRGVDAFAERWLGSGRLPCLACAVSVDGQTVYKRHHGWQDKEKGVPLREAVTGVAALQLHEQGLWRLDDELAKFLPSFGRLPGVARAEGEIEPLSRPILMRDVVTHTAGLLPLFSMPVLADGRQNFLMGRFNKQLFKGVMSGKVSSLEDFVELLATFPLVHQPGTAWEYGWCIDILGRVVEVISGKKFEAYCEEHIFGPLGMSSTRFLQGVTPDLRSRMVQMYTANTAELMKDPKKFLRGECEGPLMTPMGEKERATFVPESFPIMPGGGLVSTVDDFMAFAQCLCDGGVGGPNRKRILAQRSVAMLGHDLLPRECAYGPQVSLINGKRRENASATMSVGVACVKDPENAPMAPGAFEWGGLPSTIFWVDPVHRLAVVCFTQLGPFPIYPLRSELKDVVYKHVGSLPPPQPPRSRL